jgi:hypothetical protein
VGDLAGEPFNPCRDFRRAEQNAHALNSIFGKVEISPACCHLG